MPPFIAFFGMIVVLVLGTKGVWALLTMEPKRVRAWCVTCKEELEWKRRQAGQSEYGHVEPRDHPAVLTTVEPSVSQ